MKYKKGVVSINKSDIKLIASDIGNTLFQHSGRIPNFTREIFKQLLDIGLPVLFITGYNCLTTFKYTQGLDKRIVLMPQNGAVCLKNDKKIWEMHIRQEFSGRMIEFFIQQKVPVVLYRDSSDNFKNYYLTNCGFSLEGPFLPLERIDNLKGIIGVSTLIKNELFTGIHNGLREILPDSFNLIRSKGKNYSWLEVTAEEARKDIALKKYCKDNFMDLGSVIFFGDNLNDLEALRSVGYPVLVDNALKELKKEFNTIVPCADKQGVAEFLCSLFGLGTGS